LADSISSARSRHCAPLSTVVGRLFLPKQHVPRYTLASPTNHIRLSVSIVSATEGCHNDVDREQLYNPLRISPQSSQWPQSSAAPPSAPPRGSVPSASASLPRTQWLGKPRRTRSFTYGLTSPEPVPADLCIGALWCHGWSLRCCRLLLLYAAFEPCLRQR